MILAVRRYPPSAAGLTLCALLAACGRLGFAPESFADPSRGGDAAIPKLFSQMIRLCLEGKFSEAQPLHYKMLGFTNSLFMEGNPGGVKEALKHAGICNNTLRLPLVNVSEATSAKIKQEFDKLI